MAGLPVLIKPYDDELMYSYLHRLAIAANMEYVEFWRKFIQPQYGFNKSSKKVSMHLRYDLNTDLSVLFSQIHPLLQPGESISDFYKKHMYYSGFAPLLNEYQQIDWVNNTTRRGSRDNPLISPVYGAIVKSLQICPQCIRETEFHFKRIHQMPGVKVCPIHNTPLLRYVGRKGFEFEKAVYLPIISNSEVDIQEVEYARFAASFFENSLEVNSNELALAVKKRLKEKNYKTGQNDLIIDIAKAYNRERFCSEDVLNYIGTIFQKAGTFKRRMITEKLLKTLFILFEDRDEIIDYVDSGFPSEELFNKELKKRGFCLVSEYNRHIVTLKHNVCGQEFISMPEAFLSGWGCPICDSSISVEEQYIKLFEHSYSDDYNLLSHFTSLNDDVKVQHLTCGTILSIPAIATLKEKRKCNCFWSQREYCESSNLVNTDNMNTYRLIRITARPVASRTLCAPNIQEPQEVCSIQETYFDDPDTLFRGRIMELYGKDLECIGIYEGVNSALPFRCNVCGNLFSKKPKHVLSGNGCPKCAKSLHFSFDEFSRYIDSLSEGRYKITALSNSGQYVVFDSETDTTLKKPGCTIIRELKRPSQSSILPLDNKERIIETIDRASQIILEWLNNVKEKRSYFYFKDLYSAMVLSGRMKESEFILGWYDLVPKNIFYKIQDGWKLYAFYGKDPNYNEIIENHYLYDETGKRIGYYVGKSFLSETGIISTSPKTISVISNFQKERKIHLQIGSFNLEVRPPLYGLITEENYGYKSILSWIRGKDIKSDPNLLYSMFEYIKKHNLTLEGFRKELRSRDPDTANRFEKFYDKIHDLGLQF